MSTPLELQLMESHRQLLNTYLGSLSPEQLRAAILSQASSGPEAMLASVHLLTSNNINKPNNPIQGALVPILPMTITTAPASSSRVDQFVVPAPNVGGDQTMKEKERNDNIAQGHGSEDKDEDDDDVVEIIEDPRARGNKRSSRGRAIEKTNYADADESDLSDYEYQSSENVDNGENEKTTSTTSKKRKSRKSRGKEYRASGRKVDYPTFQKRQRMARIAFTAAFAEAYAWPAPDAATFKAALLGSPGPTDDTIPYFLQFGTRGALTEFLAHNGPVIRARSAKYNLNIPVSVRERNLHQGGAAP